MQKTVIAIVSYNSKRYMQDCLNSIRSKITTEDYIISVVDNASTDGIAEWLADQSDVLLTKNNVNVGFGPACNQAVCATIGTNYEDADVLLLNNDTVMTSTALPRMIETLYSSTDIGAVGAVSNYAGNRQQIDISFPSVEDYISFGESLDIPASDSKVEKVRLNGFAMLVKRDVWNEVGGFDEDFAPGYYEDDALSIDILKLGYRLVLSRTSFIYHVGSASFVKTGLNNIAVDHHELFIKKYGFDILNYAYPCGAVIAQIPFGRSDYFNVLHLGSGLGAEIKAIHSLFPNSVVYGIEISNVLYEISSRTEMIFKSVVDTNQNIIKASINLLIVDNDYLQYLSDSDKQLLVDMCAPGAIEIGRIHDYDDFPFDDVMLIMWKDTLFNIKIAKYLENWGLMSTTYSNENLEAKIKTYGIAQKNILVLDDGLILPYLTAHFSRLKATDLSHVKANRLLSFEKRVSFAQSFPSKDEFLNALSPSIRIHNDCLEKLDEITDLLDECYLLDYTKRSYDKSHLTRLLADEWNDCAYITAKDTFGDYGVVGFYCFNTRHQQMLYFAFSWVVNDLGIDQYIYNYLGCPFFDVAPPLMNHLTSGRETPWIILENNIFTYNKTKSIGGINILLKGDNSLQSIRDYLVGGNITAEFDDLSALSVSYPLSQVNIIQPTKLFTESFHIIIFSLLQYNYAAWESNSERLLSGLFETLDNLCEAAEESSSIILLLGSEVPFNAGNDNDRKLAELHAELRPLVMDYASSHPTVRIVNIADHIQNQHDFNGSINSFGVRVYSDLVEEIVIYINEAIDKIISSKQENNTEKP